MPASARAPREIALALLHDGAEPGPPLGEPLRFGLQDREGEVHPPASVADGVQRFDLVLAVKGEREDRPVFTGRFAHGPTDGRFLYLAWKRVAQAPAPFGWRIKIPLEGCGWAEVEAAAEPGRRLCADVRGRRPHRTAPVVWRVEDDRT